MHSIVKEHRPYREFIKGVFTVGIGNAIAHLFGFLFFVVVARCYLPAEYGYVAYIIAIATIASTPAAMGFPIALSRFLGKYKENQKLVNMYFSNALIGTILVLLATMLVLLAINLLSLAVAIVVIGLTVFQIYFGVIRGFLLHKRIMFYQVGTTLTKLVAVIFIFYVLHLYVQPIVVLAIFGFAFLPPLVVFEITKPVGIKFTLKLVTKKLLKKISFFSAPIIVSSLLYFMMMNVDIILTEYYLGLEDVGCYSVAKKLTFLFTFAPFGIITILMPKVASLKLAEAKKYLKISLILTLIASTLIFILLLLAGELAITIVFTEKYLPALSAVMILAVGMFLQSITGIFDSVWVGIGKPVITTKLYLVGTIATVIGCIFLIPSLKIFGAGLSFAIGNVLIFCGSVLYAVKYLR